ncbi:MAG: DUF4468 domain-containing protein, partial [Odoribacteraceae bacterium]|nr:DUF4468 domain-containing protein [Odoribacteraceae bacterium]
MRALFFLLCLLPLGMTGQDLSKYLEGAVPVVDGKVVFTREVSVPGLSGEAIFARVTEMVATRFKVAENTWGRLLYSNADEGVIICWGREYLVFTQKALVLDRTLVDYQVLYTCKPGACSMEISRIRYQYGEDTKTQYLA